MKWVLFLVFEPKMSYYSLYALYENFGLALLIHYKFDMAEEIKQENIVARPPVVVVVGHIDHGKSSLLEAIREDFKITSKESGGITQHVGAYEADFKGRKITFIDTPGHEAFSGIRQRGAKVADIAILVVDAVECVKTQTKEALKFVQEAGIPLVVAINKIDRSEALPEKVKKELSEIGVMVESWGGKTPSVNVSAKTKQGIEELLETILLVAEMEDLKTDLGQPSSGIVIESLMDNQKGPVVTLLVMEGILKEGDILATSSALGKVKCLSDFQGKRISQVMPSHPASVLGFDKPAKVGDCFKVYSTMEKAQEEIGKTIQGRGFKGVQILEGQKVFNIVLKADMLGSLEALEGVLANLPQEKAVLQIIKSEVGDINVADVKVAESAIGRVFGFRVKIEESAKNFAEQRKVRVKTFDIIYDLVQAVRMDMTNILDTEIKRADLGKFKVTVIFKQSKDEQIIGGKVLEGEISGDSLAEIFRNEEKIGQGKIKTVQQEKKNVSKVAKGRECAMLLRTEVKVEENDVLAVYREERQKGTL